MRVFRFILILTFCLPIISYAQKKVMSPDTWDIWNDIENVEISSNGLWVSYNLSPGKGDKTLCLYDVKNNKTIKFERAENAQFDYASQFISFKITPHQDSIEALERKKVKKDKMPKDSLGIYSLNGLQFDKIADVESFKMPKKDGGAVAFKLFKRSEKKDSTLVKKEGKANGTQLFIFDHFRDSIMVFPYVLDYEWSDKNNKILIHSTGNDSLQNNSITILDLAQKESKVIMKQTGKYSNFKFNAQGNKLAFIVDLDTTKNLDRPYELMLWEADQDSAILLANNNSKFLPRDWEISNIRNLSFSENNENLYFGIRPIPDHADTTLLESEKVAVEIWNYQDDELYTQQNINLKEEKDRTYLVQYDFSNKQFLQVTSPENPEIVFDITQSGHQLLTYNDRPYLKNISWLGYAFKDIYITNSTTQRRKNIAKMVAGRPNLSPAEKYVTWYSSPDTAWMSYDIAKSKLRILTQGRFFDELHDTPSHPNNSGFMAWEKDDNYFYFYDDYDIWKINPNGEHLPHKLTNGREQNIRYRFISTDSDVLSLPADTTILLKAFNDKDKSSGYAFLNLSNNNLTTIEHGHFSYTTRVLKAKSAHKIIFTRESMSLFPDLILANTDFSDPVTFTNANPQQSNYKWGSIELFNWKDFKGKEISGLLVKPDDFDPNKKYPLMINFYERSSDGLNSHREPKPHRSTINYTYWASKGYVIFNPDISYEIGYPGQSCYDAVMSGVDALLQYGYIDESKMGLQGHSWGGYQIAHLLTKTDRFKCAEAGAPVVNMVSAYGGIRWGSGMSRMFQYEKTQSRLGATLWENPDLYLENSPVFNLDKVQTPVLILHNDKDGAVPWYQGIEYFVGLRRLGKPCWMLNYNDEPHWPVKRQNRIDFNKRLEQFFDHYLMDAPMPKWMKHGVKAVERDTESGF